MKIYTKKGDAGETGLFGGARVPKDDLRIRTYGTIDELNAVLGMALAEAPSGSQVAVRCLRLQGELFQLGAELATPRGKTVSTVLVGSAEVSAMEREIDGMEAELSPLRSFILPGGARLSGLLHFARTVSRRAERELVSLNRQEPQRPEVMMYMNRLSDYLFVTARYANHLSGVADIPWHPPAQTTAGR